MSVQHATRVCSLGGLLLSACATLATDAGDIDAVRPNALAGPFRPLARSELSTGIAPFPLTNESRRYRSPSVIDTAGSGAPGSAALYCVIDQGGTTAIWRFVAPDARSFDKAAEPDRPVLEASEAWEAGEVGEPSAHQVDAEIWLLYQGAGGIGLARSRDGQSFEKQAEPVLDRGGAAAWEGDEAPGSPALLRVGERDFRLFYEAGGRIGEARSDDGLRFERIGDAAVLAPTGNAESFDADAVADPFALEATSAEGRRITRVYYVGLAAGRSAIGLGARFGDEGALERNPAPAFPVDRDPRSPSVLAFPGLSLLYVSQRADADVQWPAIAVAVAPATLTLPVH
jgi:hypothetical protein